MKHDSLYMKMAENMSEISHGKRLKVGAILVTNNGVVLTGCNGLPKQLGNELEHVEYPASHIPYTQHEYPLVSEKGFVYRLVTKPNVIHAELNCILKAAREGVSVIDSTIYITTAPCLVCATMLLAAGVKRVVYKDEYRDMSGVDMLQDVGVECVQFSDYH